MKRYKANLLDMECKKLIESNLQKYDNYKINDINDDDDTSEQIPTIVYEPTIIKPKKPRQSRSIKKVENIIDNNTIKTRKSSTLNKQTINLNKINNINTENTTIPNKTTVNTLKTNNIEQDLQNQQDSQDLQDLQDPLKMTYKKSTNPLKMNMKMTDEYFMYFEQYSKQYGENNTVILLQNGSFFELYGIDNEKEKCFAQIRIVCDVLDILCSRKNKSILQNNRDNPLMAGFPINSYKKHIQCLLENGYTVVIYTQHETPYGFERVCSEILSPSIQMEYEIGNSIKDNNYCINIYLHCGIHYIYKKEIWDASISCIDVTTGKISLYELSQNMNENCRKENLYMDIIRILNSCPSYEILICVECDNNVIMDEEYFEEYQTIEYWKNELNLNQNSNIIEKNVYLYTDESSINKLFNEHTNQWKKKIFQEQYLNKIFTKRKSKMIQCLEEFDLHNEYTRKSLIILCQFINNHNPILLQDLDNPKWYEKFDNENSNKFNCDYLKLENNALEQLNVFPEFLHKSKKRNLSNQYSNITSLFDVIDHTCSTIGYRYLKEALNKPFSSNKVDDIQKIYQHIETIIHYNQSHSLCSKIREQCSNICDIERYYRKLQLGVIQISEWYSLYHTIVKFIEIGKIWNQYITNEDSVDIINMKYFIDWFNDIFIFTNDNNEEMNIPSISLLTKNDMRGILFKKGVCSNIDTIVQNINIVKEKLEDEKNLFEKLTNCTCKLENTDKEGYYLTISVSKYRTIKNINKEYHFKQQTSNVKVFNDKLSLYSKQYDEYMDRLNENNKCKWKEYLKIGNEYINEDWIQQIAYIDFITNGAYIAMNYNYNKPIIDKKENSYIDVKSLRHPIIEKILSQSRGNNHQNYIPNDVCIGTDIETGYVVFGTNSCGKSVLMKSVGLCILMAQIGYYVPAESMIYSPFNNIITRITGKDEILKGHSSFTVEMIELNVILQKSNINSLVIGDEICHGTENISGISIMSSTLNTLGRNKIPFILTSHLHDLCKIPEVNCYSNIKFKHLTVVRDTINNRLIYERKLKDGSGIANYGIEVAKHILFNKQFIELAESIRYKLIEENTKGQVLPIKKSNYNSNKYLNKCEVCNIYEANQTHHIIEQHKADENGFVYNEYTKSKIHKDHISNLVGLCENCHLCVHNKGTTNKKLVIYGYVQAIDGEYLKYEIKC